MQARDNTRYREKSNIDLSVGLPDIYLHALKCIEKGQYEEAAKLILNKGDDALNVKTNEDSNKNLIIPLRNLITYRLAIKANTIPLDGKHPLEILQKNDLRITAEVFLVNGIYFNSCRLFDKAMKSFLEASNSYKELNWTDKYLVSTYNAIITEINLSQNLMTEIHFHKLMELQIVSDDCQNKKVMGLIARQKSYFFKEKNKWNAALQDAEWAVTLMEGRVFTSDYHFALLNAVDCSIECGLWDKARAFFEKIIHPIDPRVEFAYYFLQHRLNQNWTEQHFSKMSFGPEADPHFLYRAQLCLKAHASSFANTDLPKRTDTDTLYFWNRNKRILKFQNQEWSWPSEGKESVLIDLLVDSPKTPDYIMAVLWPHYSEKVQLGNRLYSLISRTNKKINGIIKFEKGKYLIHGITKI